MVPLSAKKAWQWLRLTLFWLLPESIQQRIRRTEIINRVVSNLDNVRHVLNIKGNVIKLDGRYVRLTEEGFIICVDVERMLQDGDPQLVCLIITGDPDIFHFFYRMFIRIAAELGVGLLLEDEKTFWKVEPDSNMVKGQIAGAVAEGATFWSCLGCYAASIYEHEDDRGYLGECRYYELAAFPVAELGYYAEVLTNCDLGIMIPDNREAGQKLSFI